MKVVLGTDGSDHAKFAEDFLIRYPLGPSAEVHCCGVYSAAHVITATSHPFIGPILAEQITDAITAAKEHAVRSAHDSAEHFKSEKISAKPVLLEGDAEHALAEYARGEHAAFVTVGSRGAGALEALLLGSVARDLANESEITSLICRAKEFSAPNGLSAIFATDHSEFADRVAEKLPSFVGGKFASLDVVTVIDHSVPDMLYLSEVMKRGDDISTKELDETVEGREEVIEHLVEKRTDSLREKLSGIAEKTSAVVLKGEPRHELMKRSEANCDLIIMGARGRSALKRVMLGSVSHYIATRAHCSVFIVRA